MKICHVCPVVDPYFRKNTQICILLSSVMLCNSVVVSSFFSNSCRWRILILISSIMSTASAVTMGKLSGKVALITGCFRVHKRMNIL